MRRFRFLVGLVLVLVLGACSTYTNLGHFSPKGGIWVVQDMPGSDRIIYCNDNPKPYCTYVPFVAFRKARAMGLMDR